MQIPPTESPYFFRHLEKLLGSDLSVEGPFIPDQREVCANKMYLVKNKGTQIGTYYFSRLNCGGPALPQTDRWYEGTLPGIEGTVTLRHTETPTHSKRLDDFSEIPFP